MLLFILFKYDIKYFIFEFVNWLYLFLKNCEFVIFRVIWWILLVLLRLIFIMSFVLDIDLGWVLKINILYDYSKEEFLLDIFVNRLFILRGFFFGFKGIVFWFFNYGFLSLFWWFFFLVFFGCVFF